MKKDKHEEERSERAHESETEQSTTDGDDQDTDHSFEADVESEWHHEEDYIKGSTKEADSKMRTFCSGNWTEAQRRIKWRRATRIPSNTEGRWMNGTQVSLHLYRHKEENYGQDQEQPREKQHYLVKSCKRLQLVEQTRNKLQRTR